MRTLRLIATMIVPVALLGCDSMQRASVVVEPSVAAVSDWGVPASSLPHVRQHFDTYAKTSGYSCFKSFRDSTQQICKGPRDLALRFEPRGMATGFIARFSWIDSRERTPDEFRAHVGAFARAFEGVSPPVKVTVSFGTIGPK